MSVKAMSWVWGLAMPASAKLVMLALADHADDKGKCWPGLDGIAGKCGMTRRNLIRVIQKLEAAGYLKKEARREDGHQGSNIYHLNLDGMQLPNLGDILSPCMQKQSDILSSCQSDNLSPSKPKQGDIQGEQGDIAVSPEPSLNTTITTVEPRIKQYLPDSAESGASKQHEFYLTKKKRKLTGKRLSTFNRFWKAFDYKDGKAEAADAWLEIPELTNKLVELICFAAEQEAKKRPGVLATGKTPKMAQGWISGRRWEAYEEMDPEGFTPAQQAVIDGFARHCGKKYAPADRWTPARAAAISVILNEGLVKDWDKFWAWVAGQEIFGANGFDWFMKLDNFVRVHEGAFNGLEVSK